jgi:hypothetical protein
MMTEKEDKKSRREFRKWARENNLRLKRGTDCLPIVTARGTYKGQDTLCEGWGDEWVGVYVERETQKKFTFLVKKLVKLGCEPIAVGDQDGLFRVKQWNALPIARLLKMVKMTRTYKNPTWLHQK